MTIAHEHYIINPLQVEYVVTIDKDNALVLHFNSGKVLRLDFNDQAEYKGFLVKLKNRL